MVLYILEAPVAPLCLVAGMTVLVFERLTATVTTSVWFINMKAGFLSGYLMIVDDRTNIDENTGRTAVIMSL